MNPIDKTVAVAILIVLLALPGCSSENTATRDPTRTHLYGQLDGWQPVTFAAKPMSSLVQHSFCEEGGDYDPDTSGDGNWIVFSSLRHAPNPDLYIKRSQGSTATRLTSDPASEIQPEFSPLGDKVAYASNRSGSWDIWVIGVDGTNPTRLTSGTTNDIHPSWSPDGKEIAFCSYGPRSSQWELWIVSVEQSSVKKWIGYGIFPQWSPNPQVPKIAFQLARYRGSKWFSIWTVDLVDGEAKFPTEIITSTQHACICPSWSPDADKLVYSTVSRTQYEKTDQQSVPENGGEDIWIVDLDGRNNLRLTNGDAANYSPTWAPDGRIVFCSDRRNIDNIWSARPHQVNFAAEKAVDFSKHPQGAITAN